MNQYDLLRYTKRHLYTNIEISEFLTVISYNVSIFCCGNLGNVFYIVWRIFKKLKIGEKLPFLQLKPKLATVFSSEMLLFWHTFNLISLV